MKDWTGNRHSVYSILGARNFALNEREDHDYYATDPKALELLLKLEKFSSNIWEPACGEGHLSEVLKRHGYKVISTDLVNRGYGEGKVDFLSCTAKFNGDIITNPPYKFGKEFVEKAIDSIPFGNRVAMFLKIQFLEGKERQKLFESNPPKTVYVSSGRLCCALNGDFENCKKKQCCCIRMVYLGKGIYGST